MVLGNSPPKVTSGAKGGIWPKILPCRNKREDGEGPEEGKTKCRWEEWGRRQLQRDPMDAARAAGCGAR